MRELLESGSKEKEKGEDVLRNHNLKIIPQYFHNKF